MTGPILHIEVKANHSKDWYLNKGRAYTPANTCKTYIGKEKASPVSGSYIVSLLYSSCSLWNISPNQYHLLMECQEKYKNRYA